MSCVMLEPDVVGNFKLIHNSSYWKNYWKLLSQERPTNIEKWMLTLYLLAEEQVAIWILI